MTTTPTLLAFDPGSKPGAVELDWTTGEIIRATHRLEDAHQWRAEPWDIVATELQWYFGAPPGNGRRTARSAGAGRVDVNDILKLAFRAGWQFRGVRAVRYIALKPQVWRGSTNAAKAQVQTRIAAKLTAAERKLFADIPNSRHSDVLDAIGIGRAAIVLAPTTAEYDWKG